MMPFSTRRPSDRISVTSLRPLACRAQWTTRSMQEATVGTTKALEMFSPASNGQRADLGDGVVGRIRVDRAHPGQAGIQGDQHVQALGLPDLAHHQPVGAHAQGLLDQPAHGDFAFALQVGLPALQPHDVPQRKLQFEDLLDGDDALAGSDARGQTVEHGGLARLGCAGDQDVQAAGHGRAEEPGCLRCQRAQFHQMFEPARLHHELADIDGPVTPRHVRDHDVQAGTVGKGGIHERGRHVQAAPGTLEHPFHEVPDLLVRERDRGQLGFAVPGHVDLVGSVEPDFLDGRVVEKGLEGPEPGHGVEDESPGRLQRADWREGTQQGALVVIHDCCLDEAADFAGLPQGVEAAPADQLADFVLDNAYSLHNGPQYDCRPVPGALQLG